MGIRPLYADDSIQKSQRKGGISMEEEALEKKALEKTEKRRDPMGIKIRFQSKGSK